MVLIAITRLRNQNLVLVAHQEHRSVLDLEVCWEARFKRKFLHRFIKINSVNESHSYFVRYMLR